MLYRLTPTLITEKKVYIAESPLYEITSGKKTYFAYSDAEKNAIVSKADKKCRIQRSKGLGENEPDMMWQTTMCPETRKLILVMPGDVKKTRLNMKKKLTGSLDVANRVEKFVNCRSKDLGKREIYIVEGDSALGACKLGRDAEFQAIMPVRGKILNCLKADYEKIFKNDIIVDLLRVLGCGVEIDDKHGKDFSAFDLSQLKWSKIIIATDADFDGFHIRTMILTMLFRLTPTLIEEKKVYIVESPLYEINSAKKTFFAYSDKEKNDIVQKLQKCTVQRSKGLGENEPEMMWQTTMCPESRKLISVLPEDVKKTRDTFDLLLGENLRGRKEFIEEFGHKYIDLTEVE
jgi:DNA gyrase subunit B